MNDIKKKVKAIIFDMDGTIINSEHIWDNAVKHPLVKRNITTLTPDQHKLFESFIGIGLSKCAEMIKHEFNLIESVDELVEETMIKANESFKQGVNFITGFENFHQKLQDHFIPTSIATNANEQSVLTISSTINLPKFFGSNIYHIGHVDFKLKPDPALFLHAAEKLNVKPHECVVFEDSIFGFQAAQAAGMRCIAIKNKFNSNYLDRVSGAIDSYHEAEEALKKLCR